jgi:hypothetical protein
MSTLQSGRTSSTSTAPQAGKGNAAGGSPTLSGSPTIIGVETVLVDVPLGQRTITDSQSSVDSVEFLQVRIHTDAGVTGYGFNWNYSKGLKAAKVMIDECYAPAVIGKPALERHSLMKAMHSTTHFIGRVGVARVGLAAMNLALWDIQLRLEEQPLWRHLGPCKTKVKAYNTDGGWLTWSTEELISDMQRIIDRGFDAVKMKLGRPDPREDFERVKAVRKAIGDKIKLMVIVSPSNGSLRRIDEPRVEYFNPSDCSFRICLPNRRAADISLQSIKEVHLCD